MEYFTAEEERDKERSNKPQSPPHLSSTEPMASRSSSSSSPSPPFHETNPSSKAEREIVDSEHEVIESEHDYDLDSDYEFVESKERLPEARNGGTGLMRRERRGRWWRWGR